MANHIPFDIEENEIELLARMGDRMVDQARMFDPGSTDPENLPEGAVRLNLSARKFEKLGPGGLWSDALDYLAMKVNELQDAAVLQVLRAAYPVGSVYINADSDTSPATLLGFGSWSAIGSGRVLVGQNAGDTSFDVLGEIGGNKDAIVVAHNHVATIAGGAHTHSTVFRRRTGSSGNVTGGSMPIAGSQAGSDYQDTGIASQADTPTHTHTATVHSTGSSGTNANLPPYLVVKMWKRTA